MSKLKKFDAAEYLDTPERQAAYLAAAMETGDATFVRDALGIVARAVGLSKVATAAHLNRVSLYRAVCTENHIRVDEMRESPKLAR